MDGDYTARDRVQWLWLAAATGLLVVLVVGGGWLVWRGLSAGPPGPAVTATLPVDGRSGGSATSTAVGPEPVDGVLWGFPLDPAGAASAAVVAVAATGQPDAVFDPDRFEAVAAVVFTAAEADRQARLVDAARAEFELSAWAAQPASRRMYHLTPLAVRVAAFDAAGPAARVEVWAMTLVGVGDVGGAVFTTSTVELAPDVAGRSWQVTRLDTVEGPVPLVIDAPSAPGRLRALLRDSLPTVPLPSPTPAGGVR